MTTCTGINCSGLGEYECDDCSAKVCENHWVTCAGDENFDGCDAGLCPDCYEEHVSEHMGEE